MAYKRYIKINGKVYGPYEYHSYRDKDGSVKSKYLRKIDKIKEENIQLKKKTRFLEISSSASSTVVVFGFSNKTSFPFLRKSLAIW